MTTWPEADVLSGFVIFTHQGLWAQGRGWGGMIGGPILGYRGAAIAAWAAATRAIGSRNGEQLT